jgi:restriction endonuclease S subunit
MLSDQFIKIVNNSTYGAKMPRANWDFIGNLKIGIPPVDEQSEIIKYLDQRIQLNDQVQSKIQDAIKTLEEYRSSLITQAVTGKIDVRGEVDKKELSYAAEDGKPYTTN